jgi:hypothetical protein
MSNSMNKFLKELETKCSFLFISTIYEKENAFQDLDV